MTPTGWKRVSIGDVADVVTGNTPPTNDPFNYGCSRPFASPRDLGDFRLVTRTGKHVSEKGFATGRPIPSGATLVTCIGSSIGKTGMAGMELITNQQINAAIPKAVDPAFLYYAISLQSPTIVRLSGSQALPILPKSSFEQVPILLPVDKTIQQTIGRALSTWDTSIQKTEQLIAAKERYNKAILQRVFGTGSYPRHRLSEFTRRVTRKNVGGDGHPLTISGAEGLVSQSRYFGKRIAAEKTEHYTLLKRGEYAYNKSYSAGYPLGAIKRLDAHDEGIVSTLYLCFALDEGKAPISDYFAYFCEAGGFNHQIYQVAQEGARNHGLLNVTADDFFSMTMPIPPRDVQERVVKVLGTAMHGLALLREELTALRSQKRGLMQKLLTGQWRLPITQHAEDDTNG